MEADPFRQWCADEASALRALLHVLLPTLTHTSAALANYAAPLQLGTDQPGMNQNCSTQLHGTADSVPQDTEQLPATTALPDSASAATPACSTPATTFTTPPADSALLLMTGAAGVVSSCVKTGLMCARDVRTWAGLETSVTNLGTSSGSAGEAAQQGTAGATEATTATVEPNLSAGVDILVPAFEALVSLARSLVSNYAWWQEAKANYPLLLIEALYRAGVVSHVAMMLPGAVRGHPWPPILIAHSCDLPRVSSRSWYVSIAVDNKVCWQAES
jgi:hypothetical protein